MIGTGQIATALYRNDPENTKTLLHRQHPDGGEPSVDITKPKTFDALLGNHAREGDVLINTAAVHDMKACEEDPQNAWEVNAFGPMYLAAWCRRHRVRFIHLSTDYVFRGQDGASFAGYCEADTPDPRSLYGKSKLQGEDLVYRANCEAIIVRTASVMSLVGSRGKGGKNFFLTCVHHFDMHRLTKTPMEVVSNVWMSPTNADTLAEWIRRMIWDQRHYAIVHMAGNGGASWYEVAWEIWNRGVTYHGFDWTEPVATTPDPDHSRPTNSRLRSHNGQHLGIMPYWKSEIHALLEQKYGKPNK